MCVPKALMKRIEDRTYEVEPDTSDSAFGPVLAASQRVASTASELCLREVQQSLTTCELLADDYLGSLVSNHHLLITYSSKIQPPFRE